MHVEKLQEIVCNCTRCVDHVVDRPFCKFRIYENWLPEKVTKLVVSESPPPGKKEDFLYNLGRFDRLRRFLSKIFQVPEQELLKLFRDFEIFWTMAVKCRPISKVSLRTMVKNCTHTLRLEIDITRPKLVILLGNTAKEAWKLLNLQNRDIEVRHFYHPLYIARFRRDLVEELKRVLLD